MKISIIATSHRQKSQSQRISHILRLILNRFNTNLDLYSLDLGETNLPLWTPDKKNGDGIWGNTWKIISQLSCPGFWRSSTRTTAITPNQSVDSRSAAKDQGRQQAYKWIS